MTNIGMITNAIVGGGSAAAASSANGMPINWTLIIAIVTICLTAMGTLIKIFQNKTSLKDEDLRESSLVQEIQENAKEAKRKAEEITKETAKKQEDLKDAVSVLRTEIERLKSDAQNNNRSIDDLKTGYRDLVQRLDEILRQLLELVNN